jgi:hypothetical protein
VYLIGFDSRIRLAGNAPPGLKQGDEEKMKIQKIIVNSELAQSYLAINTTNRPLNSRVVDQLASEMRAGFWRTNGDAIRISKSNVLLDGQHRLSAIVKSGVPLEMVVVTDLDDDVFHTIDTGDMRDACDVMSISGYKSVALRAGALRIIDAYDRPESDVKKRYINNREILLLAASHLDLDKSLAYGRQPERLLPPSTAVAAHYIFSRIDSIKADEFMRQVMNGDRLTDRCPSYALRRRLILNSQSKAKLPSLYILALTIKGWNAFRRGKEVGVLHFRDGNAMSNGTEKFPRAI